MGGRHYYLAKELAKAGHRVYLIAAGYTHLLLKLPAIKAEIAIEELTQDFHFVWVRVPAYTNAHDKRRIWNWFSFGRCGKSV